MRRGRTTTGLNCLRTTLPNGLRVLLVPQPHVHSAAVAIYSRSGPRFEPPCRNGISHFIEHLLFRGSEGYPDPPTLSSAVDGLGADLNGATFPEYTEITLGLHHKHLATGLEILGQLISRPLFDPRAVAKEMRVVSEEMAQQRDSDGGNINLDELSHRQMWPRQEFSFSSIGCRKALRSLTRPEILTHYRRMFSPRNLVVTMAGRFEPADALRWARRHFGHLPRARPFREPPIRDEQRGPRLSFRHHASPMVHIRLSHKACSYRDEHMVLVLLLCDVLGGGISSRLFRVLRDELGLVYDVGANPVMFSDVGALEIATSTTRARLVPTLRALQRELERFLSDGITAHELETVKRRASNHLDLMLDNPGDLVEWFGVRELLTAPKVPETPEHQMQKVLSASAGELLDMARRVFRPERRNLLILGSVGEEQKRQIRRALG